MTETMQQLEVLVVGSLRRFRNRFFPIKVDAEDPVTEPEVGFLDILPVDVQFQIMSFLSPADICNLGATSRYWSGMGRDPLLWKYFLLRDMPNWTSVDHVSMPRLELLDAPLIDEEESLESRDEGEAKAREWKCDYMSEYLRACPSSRQQWLPSRPAYQAVTSLFQYLVSKSEPRYAMFGPGMEQLDVSLVTRMMHSPDVLPVSGIPQRQINGIGSGISYTFNHQHKFNILTLYSTNRAERERARVHRENVGNKLFTSEGIDQSGCPLYSPAPHLQQVCQAVDGFVYVANAESDEGDRTSEVAQIRSVLECSGDAGSKPLLVLSCVSREQTEAAGRTPCMYMAKKLGLARISNPWMVQDTVAETLSGLLDGITWLLQSSGVKL